MAKRDIAATVKRFRRRTGLTQAELAAQLGMSRRGIAGWESGIRVRVPVKLVTRALRDLERDLEAR